MYEIRLLRDKIVYTSKYHDYHKALNASFDGFYQKDTQVVLYYTVPLSEEQQAAIQLADVSFVDNDPEDYVLRNVIIPARQFGQQLIDRFTAQNVLLGITQAGKTNHVRKVLREVSDALDKGSLYDAMYEARQIDIADKDTVFITDERLLGMVNELEKYLKIPLSTSL
jgi:hypothetical protein